MSPDALRLGVIGIGHLGRHHARIGAALDDVKLVAAVDIDAGRAEGAASATGARAMTNYRDLYGLVDAVVVAVPTVDHAAIACDFLERGVHVLVEKPMAVSTGQADAMLAAAASGGAVLAVGHTERFNPAVEAALAVLEHPRFIEIDRLSGFPERSLDIDVIFDVMIHDLDLVLAIDRSGVVGVEAIGVPVLTSRVDIANARLRFASGCIANLTASRISRDSMRKIRCFQPDMYLSVDAGTRELEVWRLRRIDGERPKIEGGPVPVEQDEPLRRELADFVDAIRNGREPRVSGQAGRDALDLAARVTAAIGTPATA